jgi:hypothetical protein
MLEEFNLVPLGILVFLGIFLMTQEGTAADRDLLSGEAIYKDVKLYSEMGHHRTATEVDQATTRWLQDRLRQWGYSTRIQEWKTRQFFPRENYVEINREKKIEAFPVWWPKATGDQGIGARLNSDANEVRDKIYLFKNVTGPGFSVDEKLIREIKTVAARGALAMVLASYYNHDDTKASEEFIGLNAMQPNIEEWPIPVIMVRAKDFSDLEAAAGKGSEVRVLSTGTYRQDAAAFNVIGSLFRGPEHNTILVSTPSSGWFTCAGERGSGIGIWLALAEWAAKNTMKTNWIFAATSGHELRGLGTEHLLESDLLPPPGKVYLWTHIGAWQAMYQYILKDGILEKTKAMDNKIFQFVGDGIAEAVQNGFGDPGLKVRIVPRIQFGDLTQVVQHGYGRLAGISFGHPFHHSTQDLPEVTGPELLEGIAKAYLIFLRAIINEGS